MFGLLGPRFVHGAQRFHFIFPFSREDVAEYLMDEANICNHPSSIKISTKNLMDWM